MPITSIEYNGFEEAYSHFNVELCGGKLPYCLITLQRRGRSLGYYSPERFSNRNTEATTDEIALNPATFKGQSDEEILSTLVHEMVHKYQNEYGNPGRGRYHNKEWAAMMIDRGLMPSDTGEPGGKTTGQSVSHYILEGGPFQVVCRKLLDTGFKLNWEQCETFRSNGKIGGKIRPKSKVKFTCYKCNQNAWAKPSAKLLCGVCFGATGEIVTMKGCPTESNSVAHTIGRSDIDAPSNYVQSVSELDSVRVAAAVSGAASQLRGNP